MRTKMVKAQSDGKAGAAGTPACPLARVRVVLAPGLYLGPGKADLLEAVARTGSISAAGRELGMSYRRAWLLIEAVNQLFTRPLVTANIGGAQGGGAQLTALGHAVVAAYRRIEGCALEAAHAEMAAFAADLAPAVLAHAAAPNPTPSPLPAREPAQQAQGVTDSAVLD
jgi:molybdate transport system regulatory protein